MTEGVVIQLAPVDDAICYYIVEQEFDEPGYFKDSELERSGESDFFTQCRDLYLDVIAETKKPYLESSIIQHGSHHEYDRGDLVYLDLEQKPREVLACFLGKNGWTYQLSGDGKPIPAVIVVDSEDADEKGFVSADRLSRKKPSKYRQITDEWFEK